MSVAKARREIGPLEYLRWQQKIIMDEEDAAKREWSSRSRVDYYMAQIALGLYHVVKKIDGLFSASQMAELNTENFLIGFRIQPPKPAMSSDELKAYRSKRSRMALFAATGDRRLLEE